MVLLITDPYHSPPLKTDVFAFNSMSNVQDASYISFMVAADFVIPDQHTNKELDILSKLGSFM